MEQGVAKRDVELVVVYGVEKHIHTRQVVGGVVDFLSEETFFNEMVVKLLLGLQQKRTASASGVVDFVDALLTVDGNTRQKFRHLLRGEEFSSRPSGFLHVVVDEEFVGISKEVDFAVFEIGEIKAGHAVEHSGQTTVFVFYGGS